MAEGDTVAPGWKENATALLDRIIRHGDEYGDIANTSGDDLRDVVMLAADELRGLRELVAIADRMFAENHAKEQARSDASYITEFGHKGPHLASALGSAGREYVFYRHRIGDKHGLPNAMDALGQRGGSDRVGADVYERELQRALGAESDVSAEHVPET